MSLYYAKDLNLLLSNLKAALRKSGMLVSLHEELTDARTSPEYHVVGRFFPALNGNNVSFGRGDIADMMRSVGFTKVISRTIHTLYGPMDLDIAYC
jgi:demethylspheroidene O-methyltransferase